MNETLPLVSVIIPCYNAEKYVEQAVRSIMNQTYKNLEILITDDCSTDSSFEILQKLAEEDARIKLFKNEQNQKIVRTLNALVERANGKYIARMDADDISLPKRIEKQVCFMEAHPDIAICGTNAWHIDDNNRIFARSHLPCKNSDIQIFKFFLNPFYHPTVLCRKELLKNHRYDEKFLYAEDYELWLRVLTFFMGINLTDKLFCYRIIDSSSSHCDKTCLKQKKLQYQLSIPFDCNLIYKMSSPFLIGCISYIYLRNGKLKFKSFMSLKILFSIVFYLFLEGLQRFFYKLGRFYA